ncbi:MAG: hypothetical protein AAGD32_15475 [Planctomycetota bacterium]
MYTRFADPRDLFLCVVGRIAAGFLSPAEGFEDAGLNVHDYVVQNSAVPDVASPQRLLELAMDYAMGPVARRSGSPRKFDRVTGVWGLTTRL